MKKQIINDLIDLISKYQRLESLQIEDSEINLLIEEFYSKKIAKKAAELDTKVK